MAGAWIVSVEFSVVIHPGRIVSRQKDKFLDPVIKGG
jgi:hypothetical protein